MHNQTAQKNNYSIFYILLASADFIYTIYNLIRRFIVYDFSVFELFSSLGRKIVYLLPLIAFIFISKKITEIDDFQKLLKIKKYVTIYLISVLVYGFVYYMIKRVCNWNVQIFPSCIFYSSYWMFSLEHLIKYPFSGSIISLILDISFWIISIMFVKSISKEIPPEEELKEGFGKTSTGYKLGIASIIVLSIQTVMNIIIVASMHDNLSNTSGEHAIGAAFLALILIAAKIFMDIILLPSIPLSIAGIIKCNSKKEIEQNRKNRLLGKKINIVCLVIAVLELLLLW